MRNFIIYGQPVAKARPRVGKWGTYTPEKTVNYENLVKMSYIEAYRQEDLLQGDLKVTINFYFSIPKSTSKKKKELMLNGEIMHNKRPDIDNCIKSITDALNEIAYKDDNQIVMLEASKYYSDEPRTVVFIEEIGEVKA